MASKPRVYLGMARERMMFTQFFDNLIHVMNAMKEVDIDCGFFVADGHRVDRNRDRIVEKFLEHPDKPEYLLMLDTDMEHPVKIAQRLLLWEKDIVGGLYFHRFSHKPFAFKRAGSKTDKYGREIYQWSSMNEAVYKFLKYCQVPKHDGSLAIHLDDTDNPPVGPLIECDAIATGSMMIHRRVLEAFLPGPWFEYKYPGVSEDLQFCMDAKEKGFEVYCDLSTVSGHFSIAAEGFAQFMVLWEGLGSQAAYTTKEQAVKLVSEFFDISELKAEAKITEGSAAEVGKIWNKKPPKNDKEVNQFYLNKETGDKYIIELLHWNNSGVFTTIRDYLQPLRGRKIIEIGSGIGTVAIQLALQSNGVTAVEPNERLRKFIELRVANIKKEYEFSDWELNLIGDIEWWNKVEDDTYEVAVCIDVFEHLTEELCIKNLQEIHRVLKVGGRLIYHANFTQQDLYPMHFDYTDKWGEWLEQVGFAQINPIEALRVEPRS